MGIDDLETVYQMLEVLMSSFEWPATRAALLSVCNKEEMLKATNKLSHYLGNDPLIDPSDM